MFFSGMKNLNNLSLIFFLRICKIQDTQKYYFVHIAKMNITFFCCSNYVSAILANITFCQDAVPYSALKILLI